MNDSAEVVGSAVTCSGSTRVTRAIRRPARGERAAAEYVAEVLSGAGIEPVVHETLPGRTSLVARIPGADSSRGGLLIHGHLDVVPADPSEWTVDPFAGEIRDGYLWGRGAVDMKDFDAMVLTVVRDWHRQGYVPPRDIVLAFTADEEAGGRYGAKALVADRADLFEGVTERSARWAAIRSRSAMTSGCI